MANQTPDQLQQAHKQMQEALRNGSLRRDLQGRRSADSKQRGEADKEFNFDEFGRKIPKPTFLRPENIEKGENYDVERVLYTTLGQQKGDAPRKITREDIMAFKDNIDLLREQYSTGITIQNIVNLSHADDIDRANEQIHLVVPLSRKDSLVHLMTNAGPNSKVTNHHVEIEFSSFSSLVSSTSQNAVNQVKRWLSGGKIKFECDCERHTYWYRYMATIGGYGLGRKENGYPKLRNPSDLAILAQIEVYDADLPTLAEQLLQIPDTQLNEGDLLGLMIYEGFILWFEIVGISGQTLMSDFGKKYVLNRRDEIGLDPVKGEVESRTQ